MTLTVVEAGLALPAASEGAAEGFAIAVQSPRIVAAGSIDELRAGYPNAPRVGGRDLLMLPGLIDSHDHGRGLGTTPLGVPDDMLEVWLLGLARQPRVDPYVLAAFDAARLARSGVGTVLHSHNLRDPEALNDEVEATLRGYGDVGIRVAFDLPIVDQNRLAYDEPAFLRMQPLDATGRVVERRGLEPSAYFETLSRLVRDYPSDPEALVSICLGPSGPQWCSDDLMTRCVDFARQHGLRMHVHALETWYQREYGLRRWGTGVLDHLDELGVLGPWLTLAHVIWIEPGEARLLAQRGVGVAHNPSSNLRLQSGIAPTAELLGAGVRVGVGLDGQALDDDQDILRELRLAWTLANRPGASSRRVDAERIWEMGTQAGAAITLGPEVSLGRLAPGFLADVVLLERGDALYDWSIGLDVSRSAAEALERLPGLVLRTVSSRHVRHVMINGAWVVRDGHCVGVDEAAIAARLREELAANKATHPSGPAPLATAIRQFYVEWGGPR